MGASLGCVLALVRILVVVGLIQTRPGAYLRSVEEDEDADGGDRDNEGRSPGQHLDG